jgi:hypothetical protein
VSIFSNAFIFVILPDVCAQIKPSRAGTDIAPNPYDGMKVTQALDASLESARLAKGAKFVVTRGGGEAAPAHDHPELNHQLQEQDHAGARVQYTMRCTRA